MPVEYPDGSGVNGSAMRKPDAVALRCLAQLVQAAMQQARYPRLGNAAACGAAWGAIGVLPVRTRHPAKISAVPALALLVFWLGRLGSGLSVRLRLLATGKPGAFLRRECLLF